jgi:S1-C subfamily serine protease
VDGFKFLSFLTKVVKPITANNSVQPLVKTIFNMKTFFNQKAWLYGLSLTLVTSSSISSIFAQDNNTSTDHKVTSIEKTSDKDVQIFINNPPALSNKDYSSYNWFANQSDDKNSKKPQLGVLLKENEVNVIITKVFPNTTAAKIGLQPNDEIISLDGKITEDIASLIEIIQNHEIGDVLVVQYKRDGVSQTAASVLGTTTENYFLNSRRNYTSNYHYDYTYSNNKTRYQKENACEELEKMYGKPFLGVYLSNPHVEHGDGAKLTSIIEGTGAKAAILKAADKITKIDKTPISSSKEAMKFIQSKKPGDQITLQVVRENKTMLVKATLGSWADSPTFSSKMRTLETDCEANQLAEKDMQENACEKLKEIHGKPFLGVYFGDPHATSGNGAQLTSVIKGTGAESATLQADDKITKMNQTPISCSKEAMKFIQNKQPGDLIKIQVLRNNENVLIDATLGSWAMSPNSVSKISKLEAYCDANNQEEEEEEVVAPKEADVVMPTFETQAILEVFPNPTADFVNVRFEGQKAPLTINIIGLNGQTMYTKSIQNFDGNYSDQLDLSKYPSGVYLIHLTQADQQMTQQVIVE